MPKKSARRAADKKGGKKKTKSSPQSTLALQIVRAALKPEVTVSELADLAQTDPAFALRLLSVVNSAAYNPVTKIESVPRAAAMLGVSGMRNLALGMSIVGRTPPGKDGEALLGCCLRRAVAARLIADKLGMRGEADECFTAGLLADFGLLSHASSDASAAAEFARAPADVRTVHERAAGFVPHPLRGADIAERWKLGEQLVGAICHHHDDDPPDRPVWLVTWIAERVSAVFEGDVESARESAIAALAVADLDEAFCDLLLEELPYRVRDAAAGFDRPVEQAELDDLLRDANARLVELNRNFHIAIQRLETLLAEKEALAAELAEANSRLEKQAATDGLTGLWNHRAFQDQLKRDLHRSSRNGEPLSLVLLDVDHFKSFNDTYGHQVGDKVLKHVARLLKDATREGDVPARYGGEEFVLILPSTKREDALLVANRVRQRLERSEIRVGDEDVTVTASFGISTVQGDSAHDRAIELIASADAAMYCAKRGGRNLAIHADDMLETAVA